MRLWQRLLEHDGIAVYAGEQVVSYAELRAQSQAVAVQLWGPSPLADATYRGETLTEREGLPAGKAGSPLAEQGMETAQ